jgi:uncharacterized protein (TIGR01370 family)
MQLINFFLWLLPSVLIPSTFNKNNEKTAVLFCYGKVKAETIKNYSYVILEPLQYNSKELKVIKKANKNVLAYISLGEVNSKAKHYNELKNIVLGRNNNWDSYYLNLKSEKTKQVLLSLFDDAFAKGFDGMFLDNIDNFTQFGPQKEDKIELISFLKLINKKYPGKIFFQNAGLELLDETYKLVDGVVVESVASSYTFKDKKYSLRNLQEFENYITRIESMKNKFNMRFILVEYADTRLLYNKISNRLNKHDLDYFIGKIDLQTIPNFNK